MDVLDRRGWEEALWARMIKTVVLSWVCLLWKEVGETPTNPSAIHRWQTQALIRHDSFETGLKSKCSKTSLAGCVCLEKLPRSYKDPEDFQLFQLQESAWEHQGGGTPRRIKNILAVKQKMLKTQSENKMDLEDSLMWYLGTWQCWVKGCLMILEGFPNFTHSMNPWYFKCKAQPKGMVCAPSYPNRPCKSKETKDLLLSLQNAFWGHHISQITCPLLIILRMRLLSCINPFCSL